MEEKTELSRQQLKSRETKERIFRAAKHILQKKGYEELSTKIYVKKREYRMEAFTIILKQRMIYCLTI